MFFFFILSHQTYLKTKIKPKNNLLQYFRRFFAGICFVYFNAFYIYNEYRYQEQSAPPVCSQQKQYNILYYLTEKTLMKLFK